MLSPTRQLVQLAAEVGSSQALRTNETGHFRPTVGGRSPHNKFRPKGLMKKPWRYWLGTVALCEIHKYLIHKHTFVHLVREIAQNCQRFDLHFQVHTVMTLQEAVEYYLTSLLKDASQCAIHVKYVTIMLKDIQLACCICGEHLH